MGTGPSAPDSTEEGGKDDNCQDNAQDEEQEEDRIGCEEGFAEKCEVSVNNIQQNRGFTVDLDVRQNYEDCDQEPSEEQSPFEESSRGEAGSNPTPGAIFVERR